MPYYTKKKNAYKRRARRERKPIYPNRRVRKVARSGVSKSSSKWDTAAIAKELIKHSALIGSVVGKINSELKFMDTSYATTVGTSWTVPFSNMVQIPVGDNDTTRDGTSVLIKSLQFRGQCTVNASATSTTRLRIVIYRKVNDGQNVIATDYSGAGVSVYRNLDYTKDYLPIYDRVVKLEPYSVGIADKVLKIYVPLDLHMKYLNATTGAPQNNAFYIQCVSDDNTNQPTISGNFRIRFYDN